jgi:hypothetical protein
MNDPAFIIVVGLALGGLGVVLGYAVHQNRRRGRTAGDERVRRVSRE